MSAGTPVSLLSTFDDLGLFYGTSTALLLWLSFLLPFHLLSLRLSISYRSCDRSGRAEWLSRCNSNVHAVCATLGFWYCIFREPADGLYGGGAFANRLPFRCLYVFGLAYFISDCMIVLLFVRSMTSPVSILAHHVVSATAILFVHRKDAPLAYVWGGVLFLTEASTPFINMRFFLAIRHRNEVRYKLTCALMTLAFFVARPIGIPLLVLWMARHETLFTRLEPEDLRLFTRVGYVVTGGLYALNLHWSRLLVMGLLKVLRKPRKEEAALKTE